MAPVLGQRKADPSLHKERAVYTRADTGQKMANLGGSGILTCFRPNGPLGLKLGRFAVEIGVEIGVEFGSNLGRNWVEIGSKLGRNWVEFGNAGHGTKKGDWGLCLFWVSDCRLLTRERRGQVNLAL